MMDKKELQARYAAYVKREFGGLVGKTIASVRLLTPAELDMFMWDDSGDVPFMLIMTDNTVIIPFQDAEGNGAGHLFQTKLAPVKA